MSKCWRGEYAFEKGDVVRVRKGHPLRGSVGIVETVYSREQFGVFLIWVRPVTLRTFRGGTLWFWAKDLELARDEEPAIIKERGMTFRQAIGHVLGRIQRWLTDSRHPNLPQRMR